MKTFSIGLMCLSFCCGPALANPPRNFRAVPGVPGISLSDLTGPERYGVIEAIQKINGLNFDEATAVYFVRAAEVHGETSLAEELLREWAGLLPAQAPGALPEVSAVSETHDLDAIEAEFVCLVRRTVAQPGRAALAADLVSKYFDKLVDRVIEKNKKG